MTTKEFVALEKRLLPNLPGFVIKGRMTLIPPVGGTLRAFCFNPSGWDKKVFYVTAFYLPLCIPQEIVNYAFGRRIKNTGWNANIPNLGDELIAAMRTEAQFLQGLRTPKDVLEATMQRARDSTHPYHHEGVAYLLARIGETTAAIGALEYLLTILGQATNWQRVMAERARGFQAILLENPPEAQRQLDAWEDESVRNLGLEEFR